MFKNSHTSFPVDFSKMSRKDKKLSIIKRQKTAMFEIEPHRFPGKSSGSTVNKAACEECMSERAISVNKLRVNYFFSENRDISEFIDSCYMEIKLMNGEKELVAQARTKIFKDFAIHKMADMNAEKVFKRVIMYTPKMQMLQLELLVGLAFDGKTDITSDKVFKYRNTDVYYPDDSYVATCVLPPEWMEAFLSETSKMEYLKFSQDIEKQKLSYKETIKTATQSRRGSLLITPRTASKDPQILVTSARAKLGSEKKPPGSLNISRPCTGTSTFAVTSPHGSNRPSVCLASAGTISAPSEEKMSTGLKPRTVKTAIPGTRPKVAISEFNELHKNEDTSAKMPPTLLNVIKKKKKRKVKRQHNVVHLYRVLSPYGTKETINNELKTCMSKVNKRRASYSGYTKNPPES